MDGHKYHQPRQYSIVQSVLFLGCVINGAAFAGCLVSEMMITTNVMGVLIGTSAAPGIELLPPSGTVLDKVAFEKCNTVEFNKEFPTEGSILGKINNVNSSISFNEIGESSMLKFAGTGASYSGEIQIEMTGGGLLEVK